MSGDHPGMTIDCIVRANETLGDGYFYLSLEPVVKPLKVVPGQFVMIRCANLLDPFLRRPMSVADFAPDGSRIGVVIKETGKGTRILSALPPWTKLDIVGPFGAGFMIPDGARKVWMVAGGTGVAPFLGLVENTKRGNYEYTMFMGARSATQLFYSKRFSDNGVSVITATEDGSDGVKGFVTAALTAELDKEARPDVILTCGPASMMRVVARIAEDAGIACYASLESFMACGFGACLGCVVKKRESEQYVTVCRTGPVFNAREIEIYPMAETNLAVDFGGLKLKNPVVTASGTFGYGLTYSKFYDVALLGGFVTKGLSLKPKPGNRPPRICETASGMLNAIGLQNIGLEKFVNQKIPALRGVETAIIVNFFGNTVEEYSEMAARLSEIPEVSALEMNISCPNVKEGGIAFGSDTRLTSKVVSACRAVSKKPLIVKLSPNVTDITEFARACEAEGADGLSVINTLVGMAIDIISRRPVLSNVTGGLSGPAIKPVALRMVWQCYKTVKIPIFGVGGISSPEDVIEFMMAGATAVQVGSMNFVDPHIGRKLMEALPSILERLGERDIKGIIGAAHA